MAQLPYNQDLRRRVAPLVDFFLAVFFVSLGASMNVAEALAAWPAALAFIVFVLLGKPAILLAVVPRMGFGERTATLTGITLGQTSEFSFILAGLGVAAGLILRRSRCGQQKCRTHQCCGGQLCVHCNCPCLTAGVLTVL